VGVLWYHMDVEVSIDRVVWTDYWGWIFARRLLLLRIDHLVPISCTYEYSHAHRNMHTPSQPCGVIEFRQTMWNISPPLFQNSEVAEVWVRCLGCDVDDEVCIERIVWTIPWVGWIFVRRRCPAKIQSPLHDRYRCLTF